jgi:hypothetical protein
MENAMFLTPGMIVTLAGIAIVLLGWTLFCRPGVEFWTVAPIWRASDYVRRPGVALWVVGCVVAWVGILLLFARVGA